VALVILKSATLFSLYFDFVCSLRHENGNLKKNAFVKFKAAAMLILSIFLDQKIVQVLSEKNVFKLNEAYAILKSAARFSVNFDFMRY
jgi:hypothetical protein